MTLIVFLWAAPDQEMVPCKQMKKARSSTAFAAIARCGEGKLFGGFLKLAPRCNVCGLDYSFADPADGPAFFAMTIMSFPVVGFALWFDAAYSPPWWVHLLTTMPLLILVCALPLRPLKGWLVCSQYFYKAEEGRLAPQSLPEEAQPDRAIGEEHPTKV
jgi:uncharacterized protein (DUF983 family)